MRRHLILVALALGCVLLAACGGSSPRTPVAHARPFLSLHLQAAHRQPVRFGSAQTPTVGEVLSTTNGTWTNSPTSYTYQWQHCTSPSSCTNINGATSSSYTVVSGDVGDTIDVVVTAYNASGSAFQTSAQTGTVITTSLSCDFTAGSVTALNSDITSASVGQVVCLNAGDYSSWTASTATKSSCCVTVTSAPGAAVTFNSGLTPNLVSAQNLTVDGTGGGGTMTVSGTLDLETNSEQIKTLNLTFQNLSFPTGNLPDVVWNGPEQANVTFNRDTFVDGNGGCGGSQPTRTGNFYVFNAGSSTTLTGLLVENSVFVAPMDLWNPGRAVQDGAPMNFENNVIAGYVAHLENAGCVHIDGLQWFSGLPGTTGSVTFTGNLCYDDYGCAMGFDGTSNNTITDNACFNMETYCIILYADNGSTVNHNTHMQGGADPGYCNSMHSPQIGQVSCNNGGGYTTDDKTGYPLNMNQTITNNISQSSPVIASQGGGLTYTNNMWSGAASPNISGTATFQGGANPTKWAGFELTSGSTGHAAGSDGLDVGIRASNGGPPTGGGSAPANTAAPVLSGSPTNGSALSVTDGTWTITGSVPTATTYQWFDCSTSSFSVSASTCQPLEAFNPALSTQAGSNALNLSTWTLSTAAGPPAGANVGDYLFVMVTQTNANGQVSAVSNGIGPVS